jgi:HSP20 family protein
MFSALARVDRVFPEGLRGTFADADDSLVFTFAVPGFTRDDVKVEVTRDSLAIAGEKSVDVPEGLRPQRRERSSTKFRRAWSLPVPVDPEQAGAVVKNGVLTVTLPKSADARPRSIAVLAN